MANGSSQREDVASTEGCHGTCEDSVLTDTQATSFESVNLSEKDYEREAEQPSLQHDLVVPKDLTVVAPVSACPPLLPCDSKAWSKVQAPASVFEPSTRRHGVAAAEGLVQDIAKQLIEIQGSGLLHLLHSYLDELVAVHELMQNLVWAEQKSEHQQRKSEALKRHTEILKSTIALAKAQLTQGRQAVKDQRDEIDEPPTDAGNHSQAEVSLEKRLELLKAELNRDQEMLGARFERQDVRFQQWLHAANTRLICLRGKSCTARGPDLRLRELLTQRMAALAKAREQTKCVQLCVEAKRVAWHALQQQDWMGGCSGCEGKLPRSRDAGDGACREGVRVAGGARDEMSSGWMKVACSEVKRAIEILADVPAHPQRSQRS